MSERVPKLFIYFLCISSLCFSLVFYVCVYYPGAIKVQLQKGLWPLILLNKCG